jgi:anti-sigma factor RsiW
MSVSTCEQVTSELVAFLDDELSDADRRPVAAHLSTCLGCRREVERLGSVQRWVSDLPPIEPSADFATNFWRRMNAAEAAVSTLHPRRRVWQLAVPALAAAAVLALVARSLVTSPTTAPSAPAAAKQVAAAPARKAPAGAANQAAPPAEPAQVANADNQLPEDLPPELVEHPELFLRLPVVRRLEKLEHFEEVRQQTPEGGNSQDGAG